MQDSFDVKMLPGAKDFIKSQDVATQKKIAYNILQKFRKMNLITIDDLTDEIVGLKGTPERDEFEFELQMDVLGELIRISRKKQSLTQEQLGKKLGIGKTQISKIENNTKDFRLGTILKVFSALNLKVKLKLEDENLGELLTV